MSISLTKKLYITWFTVLMLVAGWTIGPTIALGFPAHYFEWYPFIPVFFYLFGWFTIYIFEACRGLFGYKSHQDALFTYAPADLRIEDRRKESRIFPYVLRILPHYPGVR